MVEDAGKIIAREIRNAVGQLQGSVTPLFDVNDKNEAELLGSAVLISFSDETFLCTAKHVIDRNKESSLYFDGPTKFEVLEGEFQSCEEHDVAVLKLSPEQIDAFSKYRSLGADEIANQHQTESSKNVTFIGFPATKNRKVYRKNILKRCLHKNQCNVREISLERVRLDFDQKRNIDAGTEQQVTAPDPHGMSGGAMFGVAMNDDTVTGNPKPRLVGLSTDRPSGTEVFGSTIAIVLAIIRDRWQVVLPERLNPNDISINFSSVKDSDPDLP